MAKYSLANVQRDPTQQVAYQLSLLRHQRHPDVVGRVEILAVIPVLYYPDVRQAVEWLTTGLPFTERLRIARRR